MEPKQSLVEHLLSLHQTPESVIASLRQEIAKKPVDSRLPVREELHQEFDRWRA